MNINMKTVKSKFLHRALILVNAYKCAKFQLHSSISYGDMEVSKKLGLLISSDAPIVPNFNFLPQLVSEI